MNGATSLALPRRRADRRFAERWFVGRGLDIGCGPDPLNLVDWPNCVMRNWDTLDGDAQDLPGIAPDTFDFIYSSHCLEHLNNPGLAVARWWQVLKPGGYMILVVPDFYMYERCRWPSRNAGHLTWWTHHELRTVILDNCPGALWEAIHTLNTGPGGLFNPSLPGLFNPSLPEDVDQTTDPYNIECGIEAIVRKPTP